MTRYILGINSAYHESSAAIVADGKLAAAVEEERLNGIKHGKPLRVDNADCLPWQAIEFCLREAGIDWGKVDAIGYSFDPDLRRRDARLGNEGTADTFGHPEGEAAFQESLKRVASHLRQHTEAPLDYVSYHEAHAWYALGTSPFEEATVLVMDGIGEGASLSFGRATRSRIQLDQQSHFPASVGLAWEKVARFLGLSEYDASKVMALAGLAPEEPTLSLENALRWATEGLEVDESLFQLEHPDDFTGLKKWSDWAGGEPQHAKGIAVAAALQRATRHLLLALGQELNGRYNLPNLAYGGGVALNCRANEALARSGLFSHIHVGPATHDGGTALGAAWQVYTTQSGQPVPHQDQSRLLFGGPLPEMTASESIPGWRLCEESAESAALKHLRDGKVIGWAVGPCEQGPRALGGRSLLASPEPQDIVPRINKLKGRRFFEPLALSITNEQAEEWFEIPPAARGLTSAMLTTVRARPDKVEDLAHLLHADGSVRLQTVDSKSHPQFHGLLRRFGDATGYPFLINTSLNPRGEPMSARSEGILAAAEKLGVKVVVTEKYAWHRELSGRHLGSIGDKRMLEVVETIMEASYG